MLIYDPLTHFPVADELVDPLAFETPSSHSVREAMDSMILSASGWRKVFAKSGDEEDTSPELSPQDAVLTALATLSLVRDIKDHVRTDHRPVVLIGRDARPTGTAMIDIAARILLASDIDARHLFICAAPQIMADCNLAPEEADAFLYISASHNPIGHNGFKFGENGGVYPRERTDRLERIFRNLVDDPASPKAVQRLSASLDPQRYRQVLEALPMQQQQSQERYGRLVLEVACKSREPEKQESFRQTMRAVTASDPIGILGELNGSARAVSIDRTLLSDLGIGLSLQNAKAGQVVHAIVPEGENLEPCRKSLEALHLKNPSYLLGYVPDNDGDRGNIVYYDDKRNQAAILQAQEVFALVVLSELCQTRLQHPDAKIAVAVNGPTSMRIDRICDKLDIEVFRAEVGEANVVQLAEKLRTDGYLVPILGEGSNGGNITYPEKVRDPLNTILSLVKLLEDRSIFRLWCKANNNPIPSVATLAAIIESLPVYCSTPSFSPEAKMHVHSSHGELKSAYEAAFPAQWEKRKQTLEEMGIHSYRFEQTEGTVCRRGMGKSFRTPPYKGGLKVLLEDRQEDPTAFLWMRGSGTEPIFRIMVDSRGPDKGRHDYLLTWQRSMIEQADNR